MEKLMIELEWADGLVGFSHACAADEIEKLIELEQTLIDSKILSLDMRMVKQMAVFNLQTLVVALRSIKS